MKKSTLLGILAVVIVLARIGFWVTKDMDISPEAHLALLIFIIVVALGAIVWSLKLESSEKKAVSGSAPLPSAMPIRPAATAQPWTAPSPAAASAVSVPPMVVPSAPISPAMAPALSQTVVVCASCGAADHGTKFCQECGKPFQARNVCSRCSTQLPPGTKFCSECGSKCV